MAARTAYALGANTIWHGMARVQKDIGGIIPLLATDLVAGNTVALFRAPANLNITGASIDLPAMDTNGAPTLTINLGTAANPVLLLNASTAGRAGAAGVPIPLGARGVKFLADTDIIMTFPAGAATPVAGSVVVYLHGYIDP